MKVLFLDIDGVCNRMVAYEPQFSPDCLAHLTMILRETGASTVLSSSWRDIIHRGDMTLSGFTTMLHTHGLYGLRLIGVTPPDSEDDDYDNRGRQIRYWLARNREVAGIERYCVIDDDDDGISALHKPFVRTDGRVGLTAEKAAEVIRWLNGEDKS